MLFTSPHRIVRVLQVGGMLTYELYASMVMLIGGAWMAVPNGDVLIGGRIYGPMLAFAELLAPGMNQELFWGLLWLASGIPWIAGIALDCHHCRRWGSFSASVLLFAVFVSGAINASLALGTVIFLWMAITTAWTHVRMGRVGDGRG